jgi:sulfite exporter TauE/SafE
MDSELTLGLAFLAGIAGAGHCLSMCGGLIGAAGMACGRQRLGAGWRAHFDYHLGRILAYSALGGLAAALGNALVLTGNTGLVQGVLYVIAGLTVFGVGLVSLGFRFSQINLSGRFKGRPWASSPRHKPGSGPLILDSGLRRNDEATTNPQTSFAKAGAFLAGALNGLMPCALVFSLTLKAATAPSVAHGAAWLLAFGLGTLPAMVLTGALGHWLGAQPLRWLRRIAGLALLALGIQAVLAGAEFFRVMRHLA